MDGVLKLLNHGSFSYLHISSVSSSCPFRISSECSCAQVKKESSWQAIFWNRIMQSGILQRICNLMKHSITNNWLIFTFCPKILGDGRDLQIMLCQFMNAGWVVRTLKSYSLNQIRLSFLHLQVMSMIKHYSRACSRPRAHLCSGATLWSFLTTFNWFYLLLSITEVDKSYSI